MNVEMLKNAGIDVEDGLRRFMNSEQMFEKFLRKFVGNEQYAIFMRELGNPEATAEQLFEYAHALKGICGNLSLKGILEVLHPMVEVLRGGSLDGVREQAPMLEERYQRTISAIESL